MLQGLAKHGTKDSSSLVGGSFGMVASCDKIRDGSWLLMTQQREGLL